MADEDREMESPAGDVEDDSISADLDLLNEDGDEGEEPDEEPEESEEEAEEHEEERQEEEDEKEEKEDEKEEKEEKDEKDEDKKVVAFTGRPTFKQIKEEFPDLFKRFPGLREDFYRGTRFSELFPDLRNAREAANKADSYDVINEALIAGDPSLIIKELGQNNAQALKSVAENWLPKLREADEDLYFRATLPVVIEVLHNAHEAAIKDGDKNLKHAAEWISKHLFNTFDIPKPAKAAPPSENEVRLRQQVEETNRQRGQEFDEDVQRATHQRLGDEIRKTLNTKGMSDWQVSKIVDDIANAIDDALTQDEVGQRILRNLVQSAAKSGFNRESRARLVQAWLQRARTHIPAKRREILNAVLGKKAVEGRQPEEKRTFKRHVESSGRAPGRTSGKHITKEELNKRGISDEDYLAGKY